MKTASIHTLGCRLNQADTALMVDDLQRAGFHVVAWPHPVDLLVVNSCTVTAAAGRKTRQAVRAARRANPDAFIVLAGCNANIEPHRWLRESVVDLIVPNPVKTGLSRVLPHPLRRSATPRLVTAPQPPHEPLFTEEGSGQYPDRTRANLKIQVGCDFHCSYCIVPYARGAPRSRAWDDILREARELQARGHRELVLTGVNLACYRDHERTLSDLLAALLDSNDGFRVRVSSLEPCAELARVVEVMKQSPRVCRFLHLPLQYGEDTILRAMNRRYSMSEYTEMAGAAAAAVDGLCLGTDAIVGFPGETDATFRQCVAAVEKLPLAYLHVFRFSPRQGTPAATMPDRVDTRTAAQRHRHLKHVGTRKAEAFAQSQIGRQLDVLLESRNRDGCWEGWSDNYLRVAIPDTGQRLDANMMVTVCVDEVVGGRRVRGRAVSD